MKWIEKSVPMAVVLMLVACSSTSLHDADQTTARGADSAATSMDDSMSGISQADAAVRTARSGSSGTSGKAGASQAGSTTNAMGACAATNYQAAATRSAMANNAAVGSGASNSTVTAIEVVPRLAGSASGRAAGSGAVGGSGASGMTASSQSGDRTWRVTVRTDDGRTEVVIQTWAPTFTTGDRVRMLNGAITR